MSQNQANRDREKDTDIFNIMAFSLREDTIPNSCQ